MNKKFLIIFIFFVSFLTTNAFAFITYKQSKVVTSDSDQIRGIQFKPDGTIMYVSERETDPDTIMQYSLSTPFDISTATFQFKTTLTNITLPHAIEFHPNGTKMYVINNTGTTVEQYTLTTAWDTSTLDHYGTYNVTNEDQLRALAFKPDGTRMYVTGADAFIIKEYTLTTAWDVTSATNTANSSSLESDENNPRNIQFHSDGTIMYLGGNGGDDINKYTLSTPWDISTLELSQTYSFSAQAEDMRGFIFTANFTKLFITNDILNGANTIFEYSVACAGTITCSDPSGNSDVKAIIEANVELSKRIIKNNTLPVFHRIEWLRRHKNNDNLKNLNADIDFTNKKIAKFVNLLEGFKKDNDRTYNSDDWFQWSEGRVTLGKKKVKNTSSRDIYSYGFSIGADKIKKEDRDTMHGYVFQYGNENIDIGTKGTKLETETYGFALYQTTLDENDSFVDGIIGFNLLDIDHKRVIFGNTLKGDRDGEQFYGSINLGKRLHDDKINLNPGVKLDLGYTKLKAFREKTIVGDSLADALIYRDQDIKSALITIGVLLDTTDKIDTTDEKDEKIINHHGRLEYVGDLSPSSNAEFYFINSQSTIYKYKTNNESKHNYRIGYGFDITSISGWSVVTNFERFGASGKGYSNEFYLSLGYVPIDDTKFTFQLNDFKNAGLDFTKKINELDLKISTNYDFLSVVPNYNANISISNSF